MNFISVHTPVALRQVVFQLEGRGVLLHKVAVRVPLAELADTDVHHAEQASKGQHHRRHPAGKGPASPPAAADEVVEHQSPQTKAQNDEILSGILQNAQRPLFGAAVLHRHHGKRQRRQHQPADAPRRSVQLVGGDVGAFQPTGRHGAEDKHRHIVPAGVVAGIEGIEGAVEHRHQRKDGTDSDDALFAVTLPCPPVGHRACQTAQGQVGGHTRPFDDALRPDGGDIGRVGRQDPAQQNGQILLHLRVGQEAPSRREIDGARVLQQTQHGRPEQDEAQRRAQQALERQPGKEPELHREISGSQLTDKVDDKEDDLPDEEEIVVEQVDPHPEREKPIVLFLLVERLIQRPEHPREEGHHIHKVVEKDIVDAEARECIQAGTQHRIVGAADVAAEVAVCAAARHRELEDEQGHHEVGQPVLGEDKRQPEEGRAIQIEGVGVHRTAAEVGGPREGVPGRTGHAVGVASPLDEAVHVTVKADLLAVEIAGVVEKAAIYEIERQEEHRRRQRTEQHRAEHLIPPPRHIEKPGVPGLMIQIVHRILFPRPEGRHRPEACIVFAFSIARGCVEKKNFHILLDIRPPGRYNPLKDTSRRPP